MIYFTGDTHGDISKFKSSAARKLKKGDTVIVCGDFGFIWDNSKNELANLSWLSKRKYNILFVEGAHENYELLSKYPKEDFMGGSARKITDNIHQLIRGELYEIEGKSIFAFGGGDDEEMELSDISECEDFKRLPSDEECAAAREKLGSIGNSVDYIVTYDVGFKLRSMLKMESNCFNNLHSFLNEIALNCKFKTWYFGCFHLDKRIPPVYHAVYKSIYEAESGKEI